MAAWSELAARDRLMGEFIQTDPLEIVLHRPVWTTTPAGGRVQSATLDLDPQTFYLYPFKRRLTIEFRYNPQTYGEEKVEDIHWILIFNRGQDIEPNDEFTVPDDVESDRLSPGRYVITFISARLWDRGQAGARYRG